MLTISEDAGFLIVTVKNRQTLKEIELLLLSQTFIYWIETDSTGPHFVIPEEQAEQAREEITQYIEENQNWPPVEADRSPDGFRFSLIHILNLMLLFFFHGRSNKFASSWWFDHGRFSAEGILEGEWHRTITALTLHLDAPHLFSNTAALLLFVGSIGYRYGWGLSWLLVLLTGIAGNGLNALLYQKAHYAAGASTAVFGAVGLLGVLGAAHYYRTRYFKKKAFVPVIGALGIFALLGTNPQTDVFAHFFGFLSGVGIGIATISFMTMKNIKSKLFQTLCLLLFWSTILLGWHLAKWDIHSIFSLLIESAGSKYII